MNGIILLMLIIPIVFGPDQAKKPLSYTISFESQKGVSGQRPKKSKLIFESLFEKPQTGFNVWQGGNWNGVEAANYYSITRTAAKQRAGSYSAKFIIKKSDIKVSNSYRAELTDWDGRMLNVRSERWYGLSIFLPDSYITDPCEEQLFQWHAINLADKNGIAMINSALAMYTKNGRWEFGMKYGGKFDLGTYKTNTWTDWVLHIKFSPDNKNGLVEIWKNGIKVLSKTGKNTYNDFNGNYFKIGIYKYGWADGSFSNTISRTIYYDEIRIGNEYANYTLVAPRAAR